MPAELPAHDTAVTKLHSSVRKVKRALRLVKDIAKPEVEISGHWESVQSLDICVKHMVENRWPLEVLDGIAGVYEDFANALQCNLGDGAPDRDHLTIVSGLCVSFATVTLTSRAVY